MATSTLNISLPDKLRQFVEEKIEHEGYGTISEYIRELIRADQRSENSRFDRLIDEAYASGKPTELTRTDISNARQTVKDRISSRKSR
jgi:antitoxin ParD1/3/4